MSSIDRIAAAVTSCTKCGLAGTRTHAVPGEGSDSPSIMFIGEGPGANEDQQGRPFIGRAGKLLDELLGVVPLRRSDVYITNVVKCRPPDNRDPLPEEVRACWPYLEAQIRLLKPHVIATLGRHAMNRFLPGTRISDEHGRATVWRDIVVFPLYHPAAALRSTTLRQTLENDIRHLPEAVLQSLEMNSSQGTKDPEPEVAADSKPSEEDDPGQSRLF
ncbi:MAG: uracil-DNA glycosylase [Chloroflexi bacterium]|nr:uracil-DNA glycosylase [Chloroflexota bacterium]MBT4074415.1 uracil-DNA glycosylase [Chloroflexota bacterium]MBT4514675.1 uracil-DNA glycosylase [Chloroflexota bacterium]MBT5320323.1 uracil-DNA glycosylase [Chloroflexota bacterium]MBT6680919.1 uracil-DNA glycosylase [Chloroflexota bacterium]